MKRLLLVLWLCLPLSLSAQQEGLISLEGFLFNTDAAGEAYIMGHRTSQTELAGMLVVPEFVTDTASGTSYPVVSVQGFAGYSLLTGLSLPEGLKTIGDRTFEQCTGLVGNLVLPSTLETIGQSAFYGCRGLTGDLSIPSSVTTIGRRAFQLCSGFTGTITLSEGLTSIPAHAFSGCTGITGNLIIPSSVTSIGDYAFYRCLALTGTLTLDDNLTEILMNAFAFCGFTGTLDLPANLTLLDRGAFASCNFTGTLVIPSGITSISAFAFERCAGFSSVVLPPNLTEIDMQSFGDCTGLQGELLLPATLKKIGSNAFIRCSGLSGTLNLPSGLESIGYSTFSACTGFTGRLDIPNSVTSIGQSAFSYCRGLTGLTLSENLTEILYGTFLQCTGLTGRLDIPNSVTTIAGNAFYNCYQLEGELLIPPSVRSIGVQAFASCTGFTKLTLPSTPLEMLRGAFYRCSGIVEPVSIPMGVTVLSMDLFRDCTSLPAVELPTSLVSIEEYAFANCSALQLPAFPQGLEVVGRYAFYQCKNLTGDLILPHTVTQVQENAFQSCKRLTGFSLAEGSLLEQLGQFVWANCDSLEYVDLSHVPASVMSGKSLVRKPSDDARCPFRNMSEHTVVYLPDGCTPEKSVDVYPVNNVLDGVCREFSVQDAWDYELPHPFTALKATYNSTSTENYRTFSGTTCKTVYLPYPSTVPTGMRAYRLTRRHRHVGDTYEYYFVFSALPVGEKMEANTPHLLLVTDGGTHQFGEETNVRVPATPAVDAAAQGDLDGEWLFCGTTEKISNADAAAQGAYNLKNNVWHPISTDEPSGHVAPFRCFIKPASGSSAPVRGFAIYLADSEGEDTQTAIAATHAALARGQARIHNLQGHYLGTDFDSLPQGLYLVNGQKVYKP